MDLQCKHCLKTFSIPRSKNDKNQMFCSRKCFNSSRIVLTNCKFCNKEFKVYPHSLKKRNGKYCSLSCNNKGRLIDFPYIREINKKVFDLNRHKFKGENHPAWKGGVSTENEKARKSLDLKNWRKSVFERDGYKCQKCGINRKLQAHHILHWATHKESRFDINNGLTVCVECHKEIHKNDRIEWGVAGRNKQLLK